MIAVAACLLVMAGLQALTPYWWWIMLVPFGYGVSAARSGAAAARVGGFSSGLLWLGASLYFYLTGSRIIAWRMSRMFGFERSWMMVLAAAILAAAAGALSSHAGYAVRAIFKPSKSSKT